MVYASNKVILPENWVIEEALERLRKKQNKKNDRPSVQIPKEEPPHVPRDHAPEEDSRQPPEHGVLIIDL